MSGGIRSGRAPGRCGGSSGWDGWGQRRLRPGGARWGGGYARRSRTPSGLERKGWLRRYPMTLGHGSLLVATRVGIRVSGLAVRAARKPAPTWWAHLHACAWAAAWLTARGRELEGCREVAADSSWRGEVSWRDGKGYHRSGHRPDLAWRSEGRRVAIEVELARKATPRLEAIIALHGSWRASGHTGGVIYICADELDCERIRELGARCGLSSERGGGLRVEPLERIVEQARAASNRQAAVGG